MKTMLGKQFAGIRAQLKKLNSMPADEAYYKERENFVANFRGFINGTNFTELPKSKLLLVCDMVSTYRPVALHSFLITIAMRKKGNILSKSTERKGPR